MKRFFRRLVCIFRGHPTVPTWRHGVILVEERCQFCHGIYISHRDYPGVLLPWNGEFEEIISDRLYNQKP